MGTITSKGCRSLLSCNSAPIEPERQLSPRGRAIAELERNGVDWDAPTQSRHRCRKYSSCTAALSPQESSQYEFVAKYLRGGQLRAGAEVNTPIPDRIQARHIPGPQEMERRRQVIARLRDNGIIVSKHAAYLTGHPGEQLPALNVQEMTGGDDFFSAPDAREMTIDEIRNVEFLTAVEIRQTLEMAARKLGMVVGESDVRAPEREWGYGWRDDDPRWSLTPHQLRKLRNRNRRSDQ